MAACSHSEAEVPLIPTVFSPGTAPADAVQDFASGARLRPEPHPPGFPIRCTKQRRVPRRPPPEAETANFPPCRRSAHKRKQGLPAQCARQANIISSSFSVRARAICPGNVNSFQQSTEPDHKPDFLCSQQRPQRLLQPAGLLPRTFAAEPSVQKYCSNTALTSILMRLGTPLLEQIVQPDPRRHQCKEPAVGQM